MKNMQKIEYEILQNIIYVLLYLYINFLRMTENPKTSTETTSNIKPLPKKPPALTVQPTEEQ